MRPHETNEPHIFYAAISQTTTLHVTIAIFRAFLTAVTLAAAGAYLVRRGVVNKDVTRSLAQITMQVSFPALFFTRVAARINFTLLASAWVMIYLPVVHVAAGCAIGALLARTGRALGWRTGGPKGERALTAAVGIANSVGLPIVMLSAMQQSLLDHDSIPEPTGPSDVLDPIVYLSLYQIVYPMVMFPVGQLLLSPQPGDHGGGGCASSGRLSRQASADTLPPPPQCAESAQQQQQHMCEGGGDDQDRNGWWKLSSTRRASPPTTRNSLARAGVPRFGSHNQLDSLAEGEVAVDADHVASAIAEAAEALYKRVSHGSHDLRNSASSHHHSQQYAAEQPAASPQMELPSAMERLSQHLYGGSRIVIGQRRAGEGRYVKLDDVKSQGGSLKISLGTADEAFDAAGAAPRGGNGAPPPSHDGPAAADAAYTLLGRTVRSVLACVYLICRILKQVLSPPVIGVLLGIFFGTVPALRALMLPEQGDGHADSSGTVTTSATRSGAPPFEWLYSALVHLGNMAVPMNIILLGCTVARGPKWRALDYRCNLAVVFGKMVLMPMVGVACVCLIERYELHYIPAPWHEPFYLAAMVTTATPSANNLLVLTELAGGDRAAMSTVIITQYMFAPVLLTASLTVFVIVATNLE